MTCDGNTAIFLAAPLKLVLMKQKEGKTARKENKIKEFVKQLSDYP